VIQLRPYQSQIIEDARQALRRGPSVLVQLATGGGKTALAAFMLGTARSKGRRCWFIAHRDFLLEQTAATFDKVGIPYGFIAAGRPFNEHHQVQIVSIGTAARRLDRLIPPDVIVWDECHHIGAATYEKIYRWAAGARHVGLSATPTRLDGKGLGAYFKEMVRGPSVADLIRDGHLSQYRCFAPSAPNLAGVHTVAGDYNRGELGAVMDDGQIIGDMVRHYREKASGRRAVYFGVSVEHSKHIANTFSANGIPATHLDGTSTSAERCAAAIALRDGRLSVLSNIDLFGEGFDLGAAAGGSVETTIEAVGLARPTQSLSLHLQQIGRALRPKAEAAIILDHAGNCMRHGLPDNDREWTLEGRAKGRKPADNGPPVRQCGECFAVHAAAMDHCPYCGTVYEVQGREVEEVAGELVEISDLQRHQAFIGRKIEEGKCRSLADWQALARKRGFKPGWAYFRYQAKQGKQRRSA
jgi:superfamily II DNA or RNA helicase